MRATDQGFVYGDLAPRVSPVHVAIKATELNQLERSKNPSLRALAKRIRNALAEQDQFWADKFARQKKLEEFERERQAKIEADPKLKAEQEARRRKFAELFTR